MIFQIALLCLVASAWADTPTPAVVGGRNANYGEFPHQVSLKNGWYNNHFCGGSLINSQWVLTAAHCVTSGGIVVKAGKHNLSYRENTEQSATVQRAFVHPRYSGEAAPFDIALLKLSRPFQLNQYVNAIALPAPDSVIGGSGILSGWGSMSRTTQPNMPSILQTVTMPLVNAYTCQQSFLQYKPQLAYSVHETNICTSPGSYGQSACFGDSGGPLIQVTPGGEKVVIGIVSWGANPCGGYTPSVYTKVSSYTTWIQSIVSSN